MNDEEVEGIAHGVIRFHKSLKDCGAARRRIEVSKIRGVPIADGYHQHGDPRRAGGRGLPAHRSRRNIQSLLEYLARAGVLTMLVVAQHGLLGQDAREHEIRIDVASGVGEADGLRHALPPIGAEGAARPQPDAHLRA